MQSFGTSLPLLTTELRRKARHLYLESFHFAHDGVFLQLQPEPHLDECDLAPHWTRPGSAKPDIRQARALGCAPTSFGNCATWDRRRLLGTLARYCCNHKIGTRLWHRRVPSQRIQDDCSEGSGRLRAVSTVAQQPEDYKLTGARAGRAEMPDDGGSPRGVEVNPGAIALNNSDGCTGFTRW
jgi:hypothetical protein